jgi:hypothetical protein
MIIIIISYSSSYLWRIVTWIIIPNKVYPFFSFIFLTFNCALNYSRLGCSGRLAQIRQISIRVREIETGQIASDFLTGRKEIKKDCRGWRRSGRQERKLFTRVLYETPGRDVFGSVRRRLTRWKSVFFYFFPLYFRWTWGKGVEIVARYVQPLVYFILSLPRGRKKESRKRSRKGSVVLRDPDEEETLATLSFLCVSPPRRMSERGRKEKKMTSVERPEQVSFLQFIESAFLYRVSYLICAFTSAKLYIFCLLSNSLYLCIYICCIFSFIFFYLFSFIMGFRLGHAYKRRITAWFASWRPNDATLLLLF